MTKANSNTLQETNVTLPGRRRGEGAEPEFEYNLVVAMLPGGPGLMGYWRTWCTDAGTDLGVRAIRYEELTDWPAVTARLGLPACELPRANQTPDVEMPVWTADAIEAVGRVCADDVERFGWA